MYESLILFLCLLAGYYLCKFNKNLKTIRLINISLEFIVIAIIFLLGYNFSIFTHTNAIVLNVIATSIMYSVALLFINIAGIYIYCRFKQNIKPDNVTISTKTNKNEQNIISLILQAGKYLIYLVAGYILGEIISLDITHIIDNIVFVLLLILMIIIGALLRLENISVKELFKNKTALAIVVIVIATSIFCSILVSYFAGIPIKQSIMICSGFGWYSLSVVLNTGFIGEYYGMVTFMVDFSREIVVIATIPMLRKYLSVEMVGYAANTAMDFSLPVIRNNYGTKIVPLAISIGLIFTILTPLILVLENLIL